MRNTKQLYESIKTQKNSFVVIPIITRGHICGKVKSVHKDKKIICMYVYVIMT